LPDGIFSNRKIPILQGLSMEDVRYIKCLLGRSYGHLVFLVAIWYIFPVLVCCTKKNLATMCRCVAVIKCVFTYQHNFGIFFQEKMPFRIDRAERENLLLRLKKIALSS
jgi:hypothetical protein